MRAHLGQELTLQARFRIRKARRPTGRRLDSFQLSASTYFPVPYVVCLLHVGTDGGRGVRCRHVTYVGICLAPMQKNRQETRRARTVMSVPHEACDRTMNLVKNRSETNLR